LKFWEKDRPHAPLRYFWYASDAKLDMLLGQIGEPIWRRVAVELGLDVKLVSLKVTRPAENRLVADRSWSEKVPVVEECLRRRQPIGDLSAGRGYFKADAELAWQPCDDKETVLFCGSTEDLLLVLCGSIGNLLGHPPSLGQLGSHPYTMGAALRGTGSPGDIADDVQAAERALRGVPVQPVRFLAVALARGPLPASSGHSAYLLGTPVYVEATDEIKK